MSSEEHFDVVVVGFGAAGASAALEAAHAGARVLVLDRGYGGGATQLSGGVVYAGGGTKQQVSAGVQDTPENMLAYLKQEVGGVVSDATLERFCRSSVDNIAWLEGHGARFEGSLCPYKTSYPTDAHYLYHSGNEQAAPYLDHATPAARGHRQVAKGLGSGAALFRALRLSAEAHQIAFKPLSRVESLIVEAGEVRGVRYRSMRATWPHRLLSALAAKLVNWWPLLGTQFLRRAEALWQRHAEVHETRARAVVLAAGGFAFNREMVREHAPRYLRVPALGTHGDDGAGIALGLSAGGQVAHMQRMTAWRFLAPPMAFMEGLCVGRSGERLGNEDLYGATLSEALVHQHQGDGFLVLDERSWRRAKQQAKTQTHWFQRLMLLYVFSLGHKKAADLRTLAQRSAIAVDGFIRTVEAYNAGVGGAGGDPLRKDPALCRPLTQGPFYLVDVSLGVSPAFPAPGLSLGGLVVDEETGAVMRANDGAVPGLFAAGRTAVGVCSKRYVSGLSLADCVFSGRRAGKAAALAIGRLLRA